MSSVGTVRWEGDQASGSLVTTRGNLKETSLPQCVSRYHFNEAAEISQGCAGWPLTVRPHSVDQEGTHSVVTHWVTWTRGLLSD